MAEIIAQKLKEVHLGGEFMWISYSDSEVNRFHPVCEKALNRALLLLEKDSEYRVLHHQYTGSLEMD